MIKKKKKKKTYFLKKIFYLKNKKSIFIIQIIDRADITTKLKY